MAVFFMSLLIAWRKFLWFSYQGIHSFIYISIYAFSQLFIYIVSHLEE